MTSLATISSDYRLLTEACGFLDRSDRGKLALSGKDAKGFLQGQVSNDVEALTPGQGCYAAFLTPKGKMLGDVRILDAGDELLLDTERIALQALFNMIRRFSIGYDAQLQKRTLERGLLSLIGPHAAEVGGLGATPPDEHAHIAAEVGGVHVRAIRTPSGIDLLCASADTDALRIALEGAGVAAVRAAAAECLRVEQGVPRYGLDLDDTVIPQEAGLNARAVSFTKGCYVGQETVARLYYRGKPNRHLRGVAAEAPVRSGDAIIFEQRTVGRIGSAVISPRFGPIALALIRREAPPGSIVSIGDDAVGGSVVELPFG
jgi:folate-binding protein YgfZ